MGTFHESQQNFAGDVSVAGELESETVFVTNGKLVIQSK